MSLYADYLKERTNDNIIEDENGFATFRYLNEKQVYIIDIYVKPNMRKTGLASKMADVIVAEAKSLGCVELIGSVTPGIAKNCNESLQVLFAYGMNVVKSENNLIILKKDI